MLVGLDFRRRFTEKLFAGRRDIVRFPFGVEKYENDTGQLGKKQIDCASTTTLPTAADCHPHLAKSPGSGDYLPGFRLFDQEQLQLSQSLFATDGLDLRGKKMRFDKTHGN